jgi:TolB-like protein/Flp pilus assembly protein TadD
MAADSEPNVHLQIGHVLFMDVVGYSKLLLDEQRELQQQLTRIVKNTEQVRAAETAGKLIRLPVGDGMALVFFNSPEAPVQCAIEIAKKLKENPEMKLRMGIHSGPVNEVRDVNERTNVAGAGINIAQRVMDCGDAGHILLSKRVAEDLSQSRQWRLYLQDLGECEVKHGGKIFLVNFYTDEVGNPQLPEKLGQLQSPAKRPRFAPAAKPGKVPWALIGAAVIIVGVLVVGTLFWLRRGASTSVGVAPSPAPVGANVPAVPEKSIAVLPFENLSEEKSNAFFTDGVQNEILADLAKVADLKVISRTSVMLYKSGNPRNLREIGQQLGVAHVLEGSVQRAANRIRVTAQLIDARSDAHLWAQTYDRDLADVFAIQSEIAKTIADQLQARLSPREKAEIEKPPTSNLAAFDLYTRANALLARTAYSSTIVEDLQEAAELLNQAVALDPNFFLAYVRLGFVHDRLYFMGADHTPARRALGDAALQAAIRLRPDDGEMHLAIATRRYRDLDYDGARAELEKARQTLPNGSRIFALAGYIDRRQGRWEDSIRNHLKALELDPRDFALYQEISDTYANLRRFSEMSAALDRSLEIVPGNVQSRVARALVDLLWRGDTEPLNSTIHSILSQDPGAASSLAEYWFLVAMCRRDSVEAERAIAALPPMGMAINGVPFPGPFCQAMVARLHGDGIAAREAFTRARAEVEAKLRASPDNEKALVMLGLMDAGLGRKQDAIREGRRAAELMPISRDAFVGSAIVEILSAIYAWTGEKDLAFKQLSLSSQIPGGITYGELKLHPYWDPLRGDSRFEKIVASLAPKEIAPIDARRATTK